MDGPLPTTKDLHQILGFLYFKSQGMIGENCKKLEILQLFSAFMLLLGYYRFTATMYLLTQESKTWKIEEEARLRFSALNEADATHRFLTALFMDYTLLPTILSFQANSHSVSTREITVHIIGKISFTPCCLYL